jgi:ethanolamine-phosphate cytidylyltransferase
MISKDPNAQELQKALMSIQLELSESETKQAQNIFAQIKSLQQDPEHIEYLKPLNLGRGFVDGCFDLCHAGHFNAIRQASLICDTLVCGVCEDEGIKLCKGPPIFDMYERIKLVESCRWI